MLRFTLVEEFEKCIAAETAACEDLAASLDSLSAVVSSSDVLAPVRNELIMRRYDLHLLHIQFQRYKARGRIDSIATIRHEYELEMSELFNKQKEIS